MRDRILTYNNPQIASQCILCGHASEDTEHIFGVCDLSKQLWNYFLGERNLYENLPSRDKILCWKCFGRTEHGRVMTSFLIHTISWALRKERNMRTFDEKTSSLQQLIAKVKRLVWNWYLDSEVKKKIAFEVVMFDRRFL